MRPELDMIPKVFRRLNENEVELEKIKNNIYKIISQNQDLNDKLDRILSYIEVQDKDSASESPGDDIEPDSPAKDEPKRTTGSKSLK